MLYLGDKAKSTILSAIRLLVSNGSLLVLSFTNSRPQKRPFPRMSPTFG